MARKKYCSECGQELPKLKPTHIVVIMDMSGSMSPQRDEVLNAYNEFIKEQKKLKEEAYVSLICFDTVLEMPYSHIALSKVPTLTKDVYQPRGMTALFDAVDSAISEHGKTEKEKVLFVIITDGAENASKKVTKRADIKKRIQAARKRGCEFVFLAADESTFAQGIDIGIPQGNAFNYADVGYKGGTTVMSASLTNYRSSTVNNVDNFFDGSDEITIENKTDSSSKTGG